MTIVNSKVLADAYECADIRYAITINFNAFDPNRKTKNNIENIFIKKKRGRLIIKKKKKKK